MFFLFFCFVFFCSQRMSKNTSMSETPTENFFYTMSQNSGENGLNSIGPQIAPLNSENLQLLQLQLNIDDDGAICKKHVGIQIDDIQIDVELNRNSKVSFEVNNVKIDIERK